MSGESGRARYTTGERWMLFVFGLMLIGGPGLCAGRTFHETYQRSKHKRTMSDIRNIAIALEARAEETKRYNAAGAGVTLPTNAFRNGSEALDLLYEVTIEQLRPLMVPKYAAALPATDAWGHPWLIAIDRPWQGAEPAENYVIVSPGRDGRFDATVNLEPCASWDCDIVFSNGTFISRFPPPPPRPE